MKNSLLSPPPPSSKCRLIQKGKNTILLVDLGAGVGREISHEAVQTIASLPIDHRGLGVVGYHHTASRHFVTADFNVRASKWAVAVCERLRPCNVPSEEDVGLKEVYASFEYIERAQVVSMCD